MVLNIVVHILLMGLTFTHVEALDEIEKETLDINELFASITKPSDKVLKMPPNAIIKNISLDLDKLDVQKFRRKMDMFKAKFAEFDLINNSTNDTTRKPVLRNWEEHRAARHFMRSKLLDMMLQLIYMTRHKIKQLESERYFNRHDTSYRIAFLYRRLRKIWKKMMDIITTMKRKMHETHGSWSYISRYLVLHHKAAALHVDFLYLWWAMVNLHHKFNLGHYIPNTTPIYD